MPIHPLRGSTSPITPPTNDKALQSSSHRRRRENDEEGPRPQRQRRSSDESLETAPPRTAPPPLQVQVPPPEREQPHHATSPTPQAFLADPDNIRPQGRGRSNSLPSPGRSPQPDAPRRRPSASGIALVRATPSPARNADTAAYVASSRAKIEQLLDADDRGMLNDYTHFDYGLRNALIRAGVESAQPYADAIDTLIAGGLGVSTRVFRGLTDHRLIAEGQMYSDAAPASSSITIDRAVQASQRTSEDAPPGIVLHLFGAKSANISGLSAIPGEYEALVRPDEPFRVLLKVFDPQAGIYHAVLARDSQEAGGGDEPASTAASTAGNSPRSPSSAGHESDLIDFDALS